MAISNGYRLLTKDDVGKVFGVDLETTAYVYFADDYANFEVLGTSQIKLTDFITYEYDGDMGGAHMSFDSSVSGADNLWLNTPPSFETCTIAEGTELTTFYANTDWNTWFYVKDIKVIVTKSKITNLADKVRAKTGTSINYTIDAMAAAVENLQLGVDENSIYSELNKMTFGAGYILTLWHTYMSASSYINNPMYYSTDSGYTWVQITADILDTNIKLVLDNVSKIRFKVSSESQLARFIGTSEGSSDVISNLHGTETDDIPITQDTTLYIGVSTISGGGSN